MLSLLLQRYDMALIFWREGRNQISAALVATLISNSYLRRHDIDTAKYTELLTNSKRFENLACRTLQLCDDSDDLTATRTLMRQVEEFGCTTPIQIALAGQCMDFISHPVFQNLTSIIWYDQSKTMNSNDSSSNILLLFFKISTFEAIMTKRSRVMVKTGKIW